MSLAFGYTVGFLPPPSLQQRVVPSRCRHRRVWKRRRLKPVTICCDLNPTPSPLDNLFHSWLSQLPAANSLNYLAPAVSAVSGLALYFTSNSRKLLSNPRGKGNTNSDIGEWILFTSPTPFNRFVTLRCPSIGFPENELLEDVNERLVKEERHYVKLNSGRMTQGRKSEGEVAEKMAYQRTCVVTDDGGVLSLDWPANLDLEEERGLDSTVLIIPGTAEGSNERKIRAFVCECLRRGIFPVVMNPRGCAGSPLTTARLFTAADSDDISTAVKYISKKRPWTTIMGVGWGYGANMLTKYLAEFGERTPLTAATCIDNPFDLEEFTRSTAYHMDFEQRHVDGFIKILQCNKELFQGRGKGFDVEKALSAPSVRDFEESISMVSYGFDSIEEFYAKCSTRDVVGKVKIPVLFIQNHDAKVPLFSVPRSLIAENPFTSLLLCSYSSSGKIADSRSRLPWCQSLTLEWLAAVELGLLKGRHPLLKDIDVTINPSKGLALMERSPEKGRPDKLLNHTNGNSPNSPNSPLTMFGENDTGMAIESRYAEGIGELPGISKRSQKEDKNVENQSNTSIDSAAEDSGSDNDRGQVLQSAQVVMNMLDVTMPGVLSDEQKMKVLNAVGRGETLIQALQDAVPEEVRGKLTAAVSGIVQSQGTNIKFDKLLNLGHIPEVASGLNTKFLEKMRWTKASGDGDVDSLDQRKASNQNLGEPLGDMDLGKQSSDISQKPTDSGTNQSTSDHASNNPELEKVNLNDMESSENEQVKGGRPAQISSRENALGMNASEEVSSMFEGPGESKGTVAKQKGVEKDDGNVQPVSIDENNKHANDFPPDHHNQSEANNTKDEHSAPSPPSETQATENERQDGQGEEESAPKSSSSESNSSPPPFSVTDALDALTSFDDSTQAAVNSVFNVIEDMIDQLEVENNSEEHVGEDSKVDKVEELSEGSASKKHLTENNSESAKVSDLGNNDNAQLDKSEGKVLHDPAGSSYTHEQQNYAPGENKSSTPDPNKTRSQLGAENESGFVPSTGVHRAGNVVKLLNATSQKVPDYFTTFPYDDPLYKEYLKTYLYLNTRNAKPLALDKKSTLHLDYIPEEGQWKLVEQTEDNSASNDEHGYRKDLDVTQQRLKHADSFVEPPYVILDSSIPHDENEDFEAIDIVTNNIAFDGNKSENSMLFIKSIILKCLNVEVGRRINAIDMEELKLKLYGEMEYVANVVSKEAGKEEIHMHKVKDDLQEKLGTFHGEKIIKVISSALQETQYLKRILPVGVVVGSTLAALRRFFDVVALDGNDGKLLPLEEVGRPIDGLVQVSEKESSERLLEKRENNDYSSSSIGEVDNVNPQPSNNKNIMVGAVTAALGASALLVHQQNTETAETSTEPFSCKESRTDPSELVEIPEKTQNNTVTSLAEKALSVASPVVPLKDDGGLDHERLVAMLTEVGQKGGILKLVTKVALLWSGIRGAMSLADKLISFLRIAERPLFQRILGFVFMVLLLWSPVVLPLLPNLIQNWSIPSPFKISEFVCIFGLYASVWIMITLWGKRIRKYDDPLLQYGLDLTTVPKFKNFLKGLIGGFILVTSIHAVNSSLGYAHLCWPTTLSSSSSQPVALIKSYTWILIETVKGIATAAAVSIVEELLFRSWLPEEIASDYGYHHGIVISGLVFALSQRSMWEIPGLWLLSLSLSGARQRSDGSLSLPIGLRTGMLASNFILKTGGFLSYKPNFEMWVTGGHPFQPFSGVVGLAFSFVLAAILYPRQALLVKQTRPIKE